MRKLKKSLTDSEEKWRDIASTNLLLHSFYDEVKKKLKKASCKELEKMVEEARMHEDNLEWKTEAERDLVYHTHDLLLQELRERCPQLWKKYAHKETPRILKKINLLKSNGADGLYDLLHVDKSQDGERQ
jgi:hypothetical protein